MATTAGEPERPEIVLSWQRSRLFGLERETAPRLEGSAAEEHDHLARAARPLLDRLHDDLGGTPAGIFLADGSGQIVTTRCPDRSLAGKMADLGITAGVELGEDRVGTNAVGTPREIRAGMLIRGPEHFMTTFWGFACYGHPIVHPLTRHLEGVLDISCRYRDEHPLFPQLVRRVVGDIEDQLYRASPRDTTGCWPRSKWLPGVDVQSSRWARGLSWPPRLPLTCWRRPTMPLSGRMPRTRARAASVRSTSRCPPERPARLSCAAVDSGDGVLIDIVLGAKDAAEQPAVLDGWPLLIVGEPGTGRTTAAIRAGGRDSTVLDAADALGRGERRWAHHVSRSSRTRTRRHRGECPAPFRTGHRVAGEGTAKYRPCRGSPPHPGAISGTSTPRWPGCAAASGGWRRCDPPPAQIPRLAQQMLATAAGTADVRLTAAALNVLAAQSWPGNLSELRRVVERLARARSAGDITPADIPPSHRRPPAPGPPRSPKRREMLPRRGRRRPRQQGACRAGTGHQPVDPVQPDPRSAPRLLRPGLVPPGCHPAQPRVNARARPHPG